jgi:hypothetical protein
METRTEIEIVLGAVGALGESWRGDWRDFDGRSLRSQLDELVGLARRALAGEAMTGPVAAFYETNGICPACRCWTEHCGHR